MIRIQLFVFSLLMAITSFGKSIEEMDSLLLHTQKMFSRDIDSTYRLAEFMVSEGKNVQESFYTIRGYYYLAYIERVYYGNSYKGLIYYLEAIKYYELNPSDRATRDAAAIFENLGNYYNDVRQPEIALNLFSKAYNRYEIIENDRGKADVIAAQANTYVILKDTSYAFHLIDSALQVAKNIDHGYFAELANNAGITADDLGYYEKAKKFFQLTIDKALLADSTIDTNYKLLTYGLQNMGCIESHQANFESAKNYLKLALDLKQKRKEIFTSHNIFNIYQDMGDCYFAEGNYEEATRMFEMANNYAEGFTVAEEQNDLEMYEKAATAYRNLGNYKKSDEYNQLYQRYLKSYIDNNELAKIENERLNVDLITQKYFSEIDADSSNQTSIYWIAGFSTFIILLLLTYIFRSIYKRNQLKQLIEQDIRNIKNN